MSLSARLLTAIQKSILEQRSITVPWAGVSDVGQFNSLMDDLTSEQNWVIEEVEIMQAQGIYTFDIVDVVGADETGRRWRVIASLRSFLEEIKDEDEIEDAFGG